MKMKNLCSLKSCLLFTIILMELIFFYPGFVEQVHCAEKTGTIIGTIAEIDLDQKFIVVSDQRGSKIRFIIDDNTTFKANDQVISAEIAASVKPGLKVSLSYKEEVKGTVPGMSEGWSAIVYTAKQVQFDTLPEATNQPQKRFLDNKDGTITDTQRNLMWQKKDDGKKRTWKEAKLYCENLRLGGFSDWRLPNPGERDEAIVNALHVPVRSKKQGYDLYWSSKIDTLLPFNYLTSHVTMGNFIVPTISEEDKSIRTFVRAVRNLEPTIGQDNIIDEQSK